MGGTIAVTLRKLDGEIIGMTRHTNSLPGWIKDPELIESPETWTEKFLQAYESYLCAPCSYGLVVIDLLKKEILSCNGYSSLITTAFFGRRYAPEEFQWFLDRGRIKKAAFIDGGEGQQLYSFLEPVSSIEEYESVSRSPEEGCLVDISPYTVKLFIETEIGYKAMRDYIRTNLFPLSDDELEAWEKFLDDYKD